MIARLLAGAAIALCALPVAAQDFTVSNARLVLGDGSEPIENGHVVVKDGRIAAAGAGAAPEMSGTAVDAQGRWVTPGLFVAMTDLGLWDVDGVDDSNDASPRGTVFSAALDVAPAINPSSEHIAIGRAAGVTRATVTAYPGGSIFAGQGAVIDLGDDADSVQKARAFQFVVLGESGARIAGRSRLAAHAAFRNALREASDLAARQNLSDAADPRMAGSREERPGDALLTRFDAAALIPVVQGRQPLYVSVERAADIRSTLTLRQEFPELELVLVGAAEGWLVADEIAAAGVPVLAQGLTDLPSSFEMLGSTQSNIGRMHAAGVKVGFGGFFNTTDYPRWAPQYAGNLVALNAIPGATGLSWAEAFAAISSIPAEISGMGGEAGILKPGARADLVFWDGDPLEVTSAPTRVFVDGVEQSLETRQTRLRDRYRIPAPGALPKAYDW
ncbi:imidazolonepropionase-like amidohydrolase [Altererythrobacter atlanticus]|uniref:Hydroxydechloroatrazine ethylaminohydrolase n=1 Tax=Croceibacterium atlanticum TaxID=1267766 RepID=A0A0F7KUB7_9SPHN|nr:amidohydrolase family protein [Croceibacterium atlanticum]AKH43204.1 hydroxydechloroatrazine ethylaminohydrolase [Croceibacterium atlanticum]MBB5732091.1 imidazolonepropionase-like amidohydrolase [Croceibacterium atlanticum]